LQCARDTFSSRVRDWFIRRARADKPVNSNSSRPPTRDLSALAHELRAGRTRAREEIERSLEAADSAAARHAYVRRFDAQARASADAIDALQRADVPLPPLAGLALSVKDLFDVAGQPTSAGSRVLGRAPPAASDCPAVTRLRRAGAALTGHTNMTEFAFSGVGINPHHGTPANPATARIDPTPRIPGGSTSGGAVTVASGAAWAALGSDTGGSIRIPAALQGLVGFKNTARLTPTEGSVPLSPTLDTACAVTRSVRDAVLLHEVLSDRALRLEHRPLAQRRLAVARAPFLDDMDAPVARAFESALAALRAAGAVIEAVDLPLGDAERIAALGGFSPPEAYAWHRARLAEREADYDPRVVKRIRRGEAMSAADYFEMLSLRRRWIAAMEHALRGCDAVLSPTVPIVAPPLAPLVADDAAFFAANALLLRNPSLVNLLDGCALSLPCQRAGELPVGLMVWAGALADATVLDIGLAIEAALAPALAA
jgi:amidase/aspartyl-tRNA(Asn)/glutamyl-tRNA(Gln) amidotransferase subunit A